MPTLIYDTDHTAIRVSGGLKPVVDEFGKIVYREGVITTPLGLVDVCIQLNRDGSEFVVLSTVIDGREYRRCVRYAPSDRLTDRGVKIVAHRWIKRVRRDLAASGANVE